MLVPQPDIWDYSGLRDTPPGPCHTWSRVRADCRYRAPQGRACVLMTPPGFRARCIAWKKGCAHHPGKSAGDPVSLCVLASSGLSSQKHHTGGSMQPDCIDTWEGELPRGDFSGAGTLPPNLYMKS